MERLLVLAAVLAVAVSARAQTPAPDATPSPPKDHRKVITNPSWTRLPSGAELESYFPKGVSTSALVKLECDVTMDGQVTGCVVTAEDPPGEGFGKAALKMAHLFRMKPKTEDGVPVGGAVVTIPLHFGISGANAPPQWAHTPTREEMLSVWPAGAPDAGGEATLRCVITPQGNAQSCSVVSESPERSGFGAAAVKLSPTFKFKTKAPNGDYIPIDEIVQLRIAFAKPAPKQNGASEFGDITSLHNAPWIAAPTTADMAAAWPNTAPPALAEVSVRVQCGFSPDTSLTGCRLLSEDPEGYGLGATALKLTEKFRTRGALMEDALLAKARIFLRFDFLNPAKLGPGPAWVDKPSWVSFIPEDRMTALYPTAAADAGIKTGRVVVACTVALDGTLANCALESEDPPGKGFGQAALAAGAPARPR